MADKVIGVDVGTNAVRAAEVALGAHPKLLRFGQVSLPPGAVVEGEVADGAAVAEALRRLWREVGFKGKSVRVGIASARVILRIVEMPELSDDETRSALKLQLGDYVPMAPEATMFGFQPIAGPDGWAGGGSGGEPGGSQAADGGTEGEGTDEGGADEEGPSARRRRLLLAAAHQDAVRPLVDAVQQGGLKVAAVDVIPAALARALASGSADTVGPPPVDAIVSLGAGTTLVVVARGGTPLFARTITSVSGRLCTERLADALGLPVADAERAKRLVAIPSGSPDTPGSTLDPAALDAAALDAAALDLADFEPAATPPAGHAAPRDWADPALVAEARAAARALVAELVSEVADSLDYYGSQPGALTVNRVVLTGGGMRLADAGRLLAARLGLPVTDADPYGRVEGVPAGFESADLPFLAPYLPAALGIALGGGRGRAARIDLLPKERRRSAVGKRLPLLVAGVAAVLVLAGGAMYWQRRGAISEEEAATATARQELAQLQAAVQAATGPEAAGGATALLQAALVTDPDWLAAALRLDELSATVGVQLSGAAGIMTARSTGQDAAAASSTTSTTAASSSTTTATTVATSGATSAGSAGDTDAGTTLGKMTLTGNAADLQAVAAWLDAVAADPRFTEAWITAITPASASGASGLQFTAEVDLSSESLVPRTVREAQR